jgi:hypothetical protein
MFIPFSAWLAVSILASACTPTTEAPAQTCAIAYPEPEPPASDLAETAAQPEQGGKETTIESASRPVIPPIDAAAPTRTERATFALG